jgi:hypothetical protein
MVILAEVLSGFFRREKEQHWMSCPGLNGGLVGLFSANNTVLLVLMY